MVLASKCEIGGSRALKACRVWFANAMSDFGFQAIFSEERVVNALFNPRWQLLFTFRWQKTIWNMIVLISHVIWIVFSGKFCLFVFYVYLRANMLTPLPARSARLG